MLGECLSGSQVIKLSFSKTSIVRNPMNHYKKHLCVIGLLLYSVYSGLVGAADEHITSKAKHYKNTSALQVDPRTGELNYNYVLGGVTAEPKRGPYFTLTLSYHSLQTQNLDGLGTGWSFNLSRYDNMTQRLTLSSGASHRVLDPQGIPRLQYHKLKTIQIKKAMEEGMLFTITYKSGHIEHINERGQLSQLCNAYGECLDFSYESQSGFLQKISSTSNPVSTITLSNSGGYRVIQAKRADGTTYRTQLAVNQSGLALISTPDEAGMDDIGVEYNSNQLISAMTMPSGAHYRVGYVNLRVPTGGPINNTPAVSRLLAIAGQAQPSEEVFYCYGSIGVNQAHCGGDDNKNYLGYDAGVTYIANEDNLFNRTLSYEYQTTMKQATKIIRRRYNKFHLLIQTETLDLNGNLLRKQVLTYPAAAQSVYAQLPANYQLPIKKTTHYYHEGTLTARTVSTQSSYDDYGNRLSHVDVMGRQSKKTYCDLSDNGSQCRSDPRIPFIKYLKEELHFDRFQRNHFSKTHYYKSLAPGLIVKAAEEKYYNWGFLSKQSSHYYTDVDQFMFGYLKGTTKQAGHQEWRTEQTYSHTNNHLSIRKIWADNSYKTVEYSKHHNHHSLLTTLNSSGDQVANRYDSLGRTVNQQVTRGNRTLNTVTRYTQKADTYSVEKIHPNGYKEKIAYDGLVRKVAEYVWQAGAYIQVSGYTYHPQGQRASKTRYNKGTDGKIYRLVTRYAYDALGRKIRMTNPQGVQTIFIYDDIKNQVIQYRQSSDGKTLAKRITTKNDEGKMVSVVQYDKDHKAYHTQQITYDGFGRISSKTINDKTTHISYDVLAREQTTTNPAGVQSTLKRHTLFPKKPVQAWINAHNLGTLDYDPLGNVVKQTDPEQYEKSAHYKGHQVQSRQDAIGNVVNYHYNNGLLTEKQYVGANNQISNHHYLYDAFNRLSQVTSPSNKVVYTYTADGKLQSKQETYTQQGKSYPAYRLNYTYDQLRHPIKIVDNKGNTLESITNHKGQLTTIKYNQIPAYQLSYDSLGRLASVTRGDVKTEYTYDEFSRKTQMKHSQGKTILEWYQLRYNNNHQISQVITSKAHYRMPRKERYNYDKLNRLMTYHCTGTCEIDSAYYSYDNYNNIRQAVTKTGTRSVTDVYHYDVANPVKLVNIHRTSTTDTTKTTTITLSYNANGQLVTKGDQTYSYNERGKLASSSMPWVGTVNYNYNAKGQVIGKHRSGYDSEISYYNHDWVVQQLVGSQSLFSLTKKQDTVVDSTNGGCKIQRLYSPVNNISAERCGTTAAWSVYDYTPFGEQTVEQGKAGRLGFQGNPMDRMIGDIDFGSGTRQYSPLLRRFTTMDSLSPFGKGGLNGYAYALGNPVNMGDPTGHTGESLLLEAFGEIFLDGVLDLFTSGIGGEIAAGAESVANTAAEGAINTAEGASAGAANDPYYRPGLYKRLRNINAARPHETARAINSTYHNYRSSFYNSALRLRSTSLRTSEGDITVGENIMYSNTYFKDRVIFEYNFRDSGASLYATDVARTQFLRAAEEGGYEGFMPKQLIQDNVSNAGARSVILDMDHDNPEFLETFLRDTDNGRSSWRIANEFGMKIDSFNIKYHHVHPTIILNISPKDDPGPLFQSLPPRQPLPLHF
ncbi:hypothetical protein AB835_02050 [Candidatus Endobugula sertula]|uniref:Teneurin-like YD-shell domain-containing protein n=1 Tax=Candidatus Endobugula sertula TaxID=62101 RepID=A0A1D2QSX4_9GAMM|nr:hypothetical protein AB835_02050 [Candidatus Endobugula sertula]